MADKIKGGYSYDSKSYVDHILQKSVIIPTIEHDIYDEIDQKNGWLEPGEREKQLLDDQIERSSQFLREFILFCLTPAVNQAIPTEKGTYVKRMPLTPKTVRIISRNFISLIYALYPELLIDAKGEKMQMRKLGALLGVTRVPISKVISRFANKYQLHFAIQKSVDSVEIYRQAQLKAHAN